jgi:putative ABC transport system permease protein
VRDAGLRIAVASSANPSIVDFYQRALARIGGLPGVRSLGAINFLPLAQWGMNGNVSLEGHPFPPGQAPVVEFRAVAGDYFSTVGVPLVRGRLLDARDGANAPISVVVNRAFARRFGQSDDEIIGGKVKVEPTWRPPSSAWSVMCGKWFGSSGGAGNFIFCRASAGIGWSWRRHDAERHAAGARSGGRSRCAARICPWCDARGRSRAAAFPHRDLAKRDRQSVADRRLNGALLGSFAGVALALAALGLYGVVSYAVTQRTRELGVRLALGAQRGDLFRLIVGGGMKLAALGLLAGLLAAFGLTRLMTSLLYNVGASDPLTFAIVVVTLAVVAFLANYLPARRA